MEEKQLPQDSTNADTNVSSDTKAVSKRTKQKQKPVDTESSESNSEIIEKATAPVLGKAKKEKAPFNKGAYRTTTVVDKTIRF